MKYAVIRASGAQYLVKKGDVIALDRRDEAPDTIIEFSDVLLYTNDDKTVVGSPVVERMSVTGKVLDHTKGEKIRVATYKSKSRYRRVKGHRDHLTNVAITKITEKAK